MWSEVSALTGLTRESSALARVDVGLRGSQNSHLCNIKLISLGNTVNVVGTNTTVFPAHYNLAARVTIYQLQSSTSRTTDKSYFQLNQKCKLNHWRLTVDCATKCSEWPWLDVNCASNSTEWPRLIVDCATNSSQCRQLNIVWKTTSSHFHDWQSTQKLFLHCMYVYMHVRTYVCMYVCMYLLNCT